MSNKEQQNNCMIMWKKRKTMNSKERSDKFILLCILLGFSASMVILVSTTHSAQRSEAVLNAVVSDPKAALSAAILQLSPLVHAHAIDQLAKQVVYFQQFIPNAIKDLSEHIMSATVAGQSALTVHEQAEFLVALLYYYSKQEQQPAVGDLVSWIISHENIFKNNPFLFVVAHGPYASLLKDIKQFDNQKPALILAAFQKAISENSYESMEKMIQEGFRVDSGVANALLLQAARIARDAAFVPLLLSEGANKNGVSDKKTPLVEAVQAGNDAMVKALLVAGADPEKMALDSSKDAPVDIAFKKNYTAIEDMLHEAIAHKTKKD